MTFTSVEAKLFDATRCELGEGPLWHPERKALFWFDVLGQKLFMRSQTVFRQWLFPEIVSAAGWVDRDTLLIGGETAFWRFDIETGTHVKHLPLDADNPTTRSNDGRVDPWGGFWIGTMGKGAEKGAGGIHRFYRGQVTTLFPSITIPNAIAFAPDNSFASFADTVTGQVMRVALDATTGAPVGQPEVFLDLTSEGRNPDGAVFDADGRLWLAEWGSSRVACYAPDGSVLCGVTAPTPHTSCPAFGGEDLQRLFITTAQEHLDASDPGFAQAGQTFGAPVQATGQREHQVTL
ncbi:SMP-30/gluconolactonase/LRE family protein [Ahrensia marina]|uniref:SMP-30/gluconolactonase/LRE family protein n=1 Tax=Ahrensia marina TaxID=1514904 RepID=UPI0035D03552